MLAVFCCLDLRSKDMHMFYFIILSIWAVLSGLLGWLTFSYFDMDWYCAAPITLLPSVLIVSFFYFISHFVSVQ